MRCLQCGNPLALLKKFTDGEFCSAEHRTQFFENQQKVIMERLATSALRFKRQKIQLKSNRLPAPVPAAPSEHLPPIAKMVPEFVFDLLYIRNPQFASSTPMPAISGAGLVLDYPPSGSLTKSPSFGMAGPIYAFEFAREWARRRSSLQILDSASRLRPILPVPEFYTPLFDRTKCDGGFVPVPEELATAPSAPIRGFSVARNPLRMRPRGPVQDPSVPAFHEIDIKVAEALVPEPPPIPALSVGWLPVGTLFAATRFFRSKPRGPVGDTLPLDVERIEASHKPATSCKATLPRMADAKISDLSPRLLAGSVDAQGLQLGLESIEASLAHSGPVKGATFPNGFAHPVSPQAAPGEPATRPLDAHGVLLTHSASEKQVESFHSRPIPAAMLADGIGDCAPNLVRRFFRPALKGNAGAHALAAFESIPHGAGEALMSGPVHATLPPSITEEFRPVHNENPLRLFEGAGVPASASLTSEKIPSGSPLTLRVAPANAKLPAVLASECAPSPAAWLFKARPRGPVSSQIVIEQIAEGGPAELLSKPISGTLPASSAVECVPSDLAHLRKVNLPGAVTAEVGEFEAITGSSQPLHSPPAMMAVPLGLLGECSPAPLVRFFKSRPRGPMQFAALPGFEQIETGAPLNLERLTIGTLPAGVIGECSPKPVAQVVHQNPQGPVAADARDIEKILGDSLSLLSRPAIATLPPGGTGACSPNPIVRFFRARPRGPVDAQTKPLAGDASPNMAAQSGKVQEIPALPRIVPGETAPSSLDRPLQAAPLAGVSGQSLGGGSMDSGFAVAVAVTPVLAALPSGIIGELAPAFREKLYRMKPRGAVPASDLAAFQPIPCGGPEDLCQKGMAPRLLMGEGLDFAPSFLNRFYKMRPRGPIQGQSTVFEALQAGHPESLQSRASIPGMPAILMRQARTPAKDRTYRPGPPGPRPNSGSTSLKQNEQGETDIRVSQASMSALPESDSPTLIETGETLLEFHKRGFFARIAEFWSEGAWRMKWAAVAVSVLLMVFGNSAILPKPALLLVQKVEAACTVFAPLPCSKNRSGRVSTLFVQWHSADIS